jgi:hypothetical protein
MNESGKRKDEILQDSARMRHVDDTLSQGDDDGDDDFVENDTTLPSTVSTEAAPVNNVTVSMQGAKTPRPIGKKKALDDRRQRLRLEYWNKRRDMRMLQTIQAMTRHT